MDPNQFGIIPPGGLSPPKGLNAAMEGLVREVLRKNPKDILAFAAEYFETLIEIRKKSNSSTDLEVSNYINMYQNYQENVAEEKDFLEAKPINDNIPKNFPPPLESESPLNVENIEDENENDKEKNNGAFEEKHIEDAEKQNADQINETIKSTEVIENSENNVSSIQNNDEIINDQNTGENNDIDNNDNINKKDELDNIEVNTNEDQLKSSEDINSKNDDAENSKEENNLGEINNEIDVEKANEENLEKNDEEVMNENNQVNEKASESLNSEDTMKDNQPSVIDNSDNVIIENNVQSDENEMKLEEAEKVTTRVDETSPTEQVEIINKSSIENIDMNEKVINEKNNDPEVIDNDIISRVENENNVSEEVIEKNYTEIITENIDSKVTCENIESRESIEKNDSEVINDNIELEKEVNEDINTEVITEKTDSEETIENNDSEVVNAIIEPEEAFEKKDSEEQKENIESKESVEKNDSEEQKENIEPKESVEKNDSEVINANIEHKEEIENIDTEAIIEKSDNEVAIENIVSEVSKDNTEPIEIIEKTNPTESNENIDSNILNENTETEEIVKKIDSEEPIEKVEIIEVNSENVELPIDENQNMDQNLIELTNLEAKSESLENVIFKSSEFLTVENSNNILEDPESNESVPLLIESNSIEKESDVIDNLVKGESKIPEENSEQVNEKTNDLDLDKIEKEKLEPSDEKDNETKTESFDTVENEDVTNSNLEPKVFITSEKLQKTVTFELDSTPNISDSENEEKMARFEDAATLIQKIFKGFIVRLKSPGKIQEKKKMLQRQNNEKSSENESSLDINDSIIIAPVNSETLLSTVPEEKNNSYSTEEESSTFSSAATKIQANVRGYMTRKYLQRNRTNNSSDTTAPSIGEDSKSLDDIGNVLESNISTEDTVNKIIVASSSVLVEQLEHFEQLGNRTFDNNLGSFELSKDGDESSTRIRKRLRREDAIQLHSPYSSEETSINKQSPLKNSDDEEPIGDLAQSIITEIVSNTYQPDSNDVEKIEKETEDMDGNVLETAEGIVESIVAEVAEVKLEEEKIDSSTEKEEVKEYDLDTIQKDSNVEKVADEEVLETAEGIVKSIEAEAAEVQLEEKVDSTTENEEIKESDLNTIQNDSNMEIVADEAVLETAEGIIKSIEAEVAEVQLEEEKIESAAEKEDVKEADLDTIQKDPNIENVADEEILETAEGIVKSIEAEVAEVQLEEKVDSTTENEEVIESGSDTIQKDSNMENVADEEVLETAEGIVKSIEAEVAEVQLEEEKIDSTTEKEDVIESGSDTIQKDSNMENVADEQVLETAEGIVESIVAEVAEVKLEHTLEENKIDSNTEKEALIESDLDAIQKDSNKENVFDEKTIKISKAESVQSDDNDVIVGSMKISRPRSSEISEVKDNIESKVGSDIYSKTNIFQSMEKSSLEKALECDVIQSILEKKEMADAQKMSETNVPEKPSKLMHSGEFHDTVLPTKIIRKSTSAAKGRSSQSHL